MTRWGGPYSPKRFERVDERDVVAEASKIKGGMTAREEASLLKARTQFLRVSK